MNSLLLFFSDNPMSLITPDPGLFIWTVIIFTLLLVLLSKTAFPAIFNGIRSRNESISDALKAAERARAEVAELKSENEEILKQAREERSRILRDANELKAQIVNKAREQAQQEADQLITNARLDIQNQKQRAMKEVRSDVGRIAAEIAEQVIRRELGNQKEQEDLIASLVSKSDLN